MMSRRPPDPGPEDDFALIIVSALVCGLVFLGYVVSSLTTGAMP